MEIHAIDGSRHNVDHAEERRIYHELEAKYKHSGANSAAVQKHHFNINGAMVALSAAEMKEIADAWWEHYGKSKMTEFFTGYQKKAGENIAAALNCKEPPKNEPEVKGAIAMALQCGNTDLAGEVIFEAMEWCYAYAGLESIGD